MDNLLSTKFLLSLVALSLSFTLVMFDKSSVDLFTNIVYVSLGLYTAANVGQKFIPESSSSRTKTVETTETKPITQA